MQKDTHTHRMRERERKWKADIKGRKNNWNKVQESYLTKNPTFTKWIHTRKR